METKAMYEQGEYTEEMLTSGINEVPTLNSYNWLKWMLVVFMLVVPGVIVLSVRKEHIVICLLAYMNCMIIGFGVWRFLRKGTLAAT